MKITGNVLIVRIGFLLLLAGALFHFVAELPYLFDGLWRFYIEIFGDSVYMFLYILIYLTFMAGMLFIHGLFRSIGAIVVGIYIIVSTIPVVLFQFLFFMDFTFPFMSGMIVSIIIAIFYLSLLAGAVYYLFVNKTFSSALLVIPFLMYFIFINYYSLIINLPALWEFYEALIFFYGLASLFASLFLGIYSIIALITARSAGNQV